MNGPFRLTRLPLLVGVALTTACSDGSGGPTEQKQDHLNLRIETAYLVQSTQTRDGTIPLVAGKDAYLRVFAVADRANTETPAVRVRFYQGGALKETMTLPAGGTSVPTAVDQATLTASWNVKISGSLIQPGLQMVADVDPGNAVAESNEQDNAFPSDGSQKALNVVAMQPFRMRFVPIVQENGPTGQVSDANKEDYLVLTRKIHPVVTIDSDMHAPYTVQGLGFDTQGNTWQTAVAALDAARVAEGSNRFYYGVVKTPYNGGGVVGIAAGIPASTALGWDRFPDASSTLAHEIGHDWGRFHSPCGGAGGADPQYPYVQGVIGVFGMDVTTGELKTPSANTDIMGYCNANFWISDYTYLGILNYRVAHPATANVVPVPSLLVWGRIRNGELELEPAFQVTTAPVLPSASGPYRVEGVDEAGKTLFSLSFAGNPVSDVPAEGRTFAFAVPLAPEQAVRLSSLRAVSRGKATLVRSTLAQAAALAPGARGNVIPAPALSMAPAGNGRISMRWNRSTYPGVMVRDPRTGEVLSFVNGGDATVNTSAPEVEVVFSDGVRSTAKRMRVPGN
ncbi:MAG: hypothetical protein JO040_03260 [Gemmatimonadetes bacterium]|nr:hypothetical protein [Gemmatimonadota bacterium]